MANVYNFGASGDGRNDDTEAMQHALDAGDGILDLHKGTYRISQPLVIDMTKSGYAAVRGVGGASRIIMTGPGPAIRLLGDHQGTADPGSFKDHTWENERFPTISGVEILGEHPEAVGIELRKTMQATITQVLVRHCKVGVHLVERNRNFILADSHIYDNHEYGVFFDNCNLHQAIIHGNHISYNKRGGIKTLDGDVHNFHITGNDIEYNNRPGLDESPNSEPTGGEIWFESPNGSISEVSIASNTIQATVQPGGANIRIWGPPELSLIGAWLIAITGNVIGSQNRGLDLRHVRRITVTGNTIYDSRDLSLYAENCSSLIYSANTISWRTDDERPLSDGIRLVDCENCILSSLSGERIASGTAEEGGAISLINSKAITVSQCILLDCNHRGIDVADCDHCQIQGNTITDRRDPVRMLQAVRVRGTSKGNVVQGNIVSGAAGELIDVAEGTAEVQGNVEL
ncbi:MAG: right-handed parallel beta-helix repeat-containing protein [Planctomycetaceae bacterium]